MRRLNFLKLFLVLILLTVTSCSHKEKKYNYASVLKKNPIVHLYYFYSPGCADCDYVKNVIFPEIEKENSILLQVDYYNIDESENLEKVLFLEKKLDKEVPEFPVVFWGNTFLAGDNKIETELSGRLAVYKKQILKSNKVKEYLSEFSRSSSGKKEVLKTIQIFPIMVSGLLDGINPCAFSTIIFLISFLVFMKFQKKEILLIGIFYTFGVFLFYFLAGFGFFKLLKSLSFIRILSSVIKYISVVLVAVLFGFSVFDIIRTIRTGRYRFFLSLPLKVKQKIHSRIRQKLHSRSLFLSAFLLGCFISFLELACTGQIYLPSILYMLQDKSLQMRGFGLLLLYNLFFIIPLVAVFIVVYMGVSAKQIEVLFKKHLLAVKTATALFFAFILLYLIF